MPEDPSQQFSYNPLLQRFFLSPEQKADKENGKKIIKAIYAQQTTNDSNLNYFKARNARWVMLLLWAKGSHNIQEFLDYMNVSDGNKAWVNLDLTQTRIAPQFVGTLVESMAKNKIYPCVRAVDDGSITEKEKRKDDALFRMHELQTIKDAQQQSGVQLEPTNAFVPDDEMSARVYFELEDQLPKEIRFEKMLAYLQKTIDFDNVLVRKTLYDLIVLNCFVTKVERLAPQEYTVRKCIPTNMTFNFFLNDTGEWEITQIGEFYNLKVKDFRKKFGASPENPTGLTEKEIFNLARLSTNKNVGTFNYMWNENWAIMTYNQTRPYDDATVLVYDCEVNFSEEQYYVSKKDSYGRENISVKKGIPYQQKTKDGKIIEQKKPDNTEVIKSQKQTWMRGVYAPFGDTMLYWGEPDIIVTPYANVAKPLSSYSVVIPNNDGEYVPSLFERCMEPLREYQLTKLKRKQLIAKIKPSGIRIDIESARNIDLGNGDTIPWEEIVRIYDQTGNELWSSKGIDPLQREAPPLSNTVRNETIMDIVGLTNILAGITNEIRQLIGVPMYRDGSDVGDRTAATLAEGQNQSSFNVTNFVIAANNQGWEETFYKVCLLHWNDIVKEEPEYKADMINTRFDVKVKMKISDAEKAQLEADIQRYSQMPDAQGNPSLSLKDAMMIREIEDTKLARWYLSSVFEKNRKQAILDSQQLQSQNAQVQQQSAQQAQEQAQQMQKDKMAAEKDLEEFRSTKAKELAVVNGLMLSISKGMIPSSVVMPVIQQIIPNIKIPLIQENKELVAETIATAHDQMAHQFAQGQMGQPDQSQQQNQPNPQQEMQSQMQTQPQNQ